MSPGFQLHPGVLLRTTREALIVVHVETDAVYHFHVLTAPFFDFFKSPRLLDDFALLHSLENDPAQVEKLEEFCAQLVDMHILQPASAEPMNIPVGMREESEFNLDHAGQAVSGNSLADVAFLYP